MIAEHPRLESAILGGVLGLLAAGATLGWEAAWIGWLDLGMPAADDALAILGAVCAAGASAGAVLGLIGLGGSRWAVVAAAAWAGWTLAPLANVPVAVIAAVLAWGLTSVRRSGRWFLFIASVAWTFLALVVPAWTHAFSSPVAGVGALVSVGAILMALGVGVWAWRWYEPGIFPAAFGFGVLGAVGWFIAVPAVTAGPPMWPMADRAGTPVVLVTIRGLDADHPPMPSLARWAASTVAWSELRAEGSGPDELARILTGAEPAAYGWLRGTLVGSEAPTLAERLAAGDYATLAIVGRSGLSVQSGLYRGFDRYVELPAPETVWWGDFGRSRSASADDVASAARDFVGRQAHGRWLLWVDFTDFTDGTPPSVERTDRAIGRLLRAVPKSAVVVVVGAPTARDARGVLWVRDPRATPGLVDRPVSTLDIVPTVLARLYFDVPERLVGRPFPELGAPDAPLAGVREDPAVRPDPLVRELWYWLAKSGRFHRPSLASGAPESVSRNR